MENNFVANLIQEFCFSFEFLQSLVISSLSTNRNGVFNLKNISCNVQHCCFFRIGLVVSKVRKLVLNMENAQFVLLAHVHPKSFPALQPDK